MIVPRGPGYNALVRHADIIEASRHPPDFCSGKGAITIPDMPGDLHEYFGSMINMDDPRHARMRRIVSRAFTPADARAVRGPTSRPCAERIVDDVVARRAPATSSPTWPRGCRCGSSAT